MPASLLTHAAVVGGLIAIALRAPVEPPDAPASVPSILVFPAAAAAPPPPRGDPSGLRPRRQPARTMEEPEAVTPTLVQIAQQAPVEAEPAEPETEAGSPNGIDGGVPEGIDGGRLGGTGVDPNGRLDGCVGCDGEGPATDYDRPPQPLRIDRPIYPQRAFIDKIEGTVLLEILIDARGMVVDARPLGRPHPALLPAALETVRRWQFAPAMRHGRPVAVWARAPVKFTMF